MLSERALKLLLILSIPEGVEQDIGIGEVHGRALRRARRRRRPFHGGAFPLFAPAAFAHCRRLTQPSRSTRSVPSGVLASEGQAFGFFDAASTAPAKREPPCRRSVTGLTEPTSRNRRSCALRGATVRTQT